jgi:protein SPIRAL1 and related proteins
MGRGVSAGGGQSSLGYLFGSGEETPKPVAEKLEPVQKMPPSPVDKTKQVPAGIQGGGSQTNNYFRAEGQNCGNFLTVCKFFSISFHFGGLGGHFVCKLFSFLYIIIIIIILLIIRVIKAKFEIYEWQWRGANMSLPVARIFVNASLSVTSFVVDRQ